MMVVALVIVPPCYIPCEGRRHKHHPRSVNLLQTKRITSPSFRASGMEVLPTYNGGIRAGERGYTHT